MANPIEIKKNIKIAIMSSLKRDNSAKLDVLKSSLALETGYTDKVISKIFEDLEKIGLINIDGNSATITDKGRSER